jgi:hypothetical protein
MGGYASDRNQWRLVEAVAYARDSGKEVILLVRLEQDTVQVVIDPPGFPESRV